MNTVLNESLYKKQSSRFNEINDKANAFAGAFCKNILLRDSIFNVVENYARKRNESLEILRYPFHDSELWAFTFVKEGTIFLCINSELSMCKQIFAAAHELYHIDCYVENKDLDIITNGSVLDSKTADEVARTQEDMEANAFAGLLLMPDSIMKDVVTLFALEEVEVDDVLMLMDLFAMPYKAVVLRLYEGKIITEQDANELLEYTATCIEERINITGKAKQWQLDSKEIQYFGSLMDNLEYNTKNELLTESREASDRAYLEKLKENF